MSSSRWNVVVINDIFWYISFEQKKSIQWNAMEYYESVHRGLVARQSNEKWFTNGNQKVAGIFLTILTIRWHVNKYSQWKNTWLQQIVTSNNIVHVCMHLTNTKPFVLRWNVRQQTCTTPSEWDFLWFCFIFNFKPRIDYRLDNIEFVLKLVWFVRQMLAIDVWGNNDPPSEISNEYTFTMESLRRKGNNQKMSQFIFVFLHFGSVSNEMIRLGAYNQMRISCVKPNTGYYFLSFSF